MKMPRKIRLDLMTPPEAALRAARAAVEAMPADTRLTNASMKVGEALDLVSDYVDEQMCGVSFDPGPPKEDSRPRCDEPTGENTKCGLWRGHAGMHRPGEG